ncbi:NACHT domain-containing protein [Streptomyces cyaneofuscatus]|uniref:NACHT domain-containing protein n=1 Tax=Streptomyces cyaneofuscatus TaxID=66883 RepID=UPI0029546A6E|nr:NACHT domain-containing protein [Streptomyces cyaneofuscatus]WOP10568.1 NACHT domain-containing protein [Streptomyces cyaneofuscatus]
MDEKRELRLHTVLRHLKPPLAVVTVAGLLWTVWTLVKGGLGPGDTAGVLALPLTALAAWLAVVAILKRRPDAKTTATRLAELVRSAEEKAVAQLLGVGTPDIDTRFRVPGDRQPRTGVVDHFRTLRPRRVMITGEPGAGKTMLVIHLMLALLESREPGAPVPVRFSAKAWKPDRPFDTWFAEQIKRVHALSEAEAHDVVTGHHVIPVLDGVDEMSYTHATALLKQLSSDRQNMDQRPVILTCRSELYERLSEDHPLTNAHHLAVEPLTGTQSLTFLAHHPRVLTNTERWEPVLTELRTAPDGPLARSLSSPWRLTLAVTAYARDPAGLVERAAAGDLYEHMLARYIPATVRLHVAEADEKGYAEGDVQRWLGELAWHFGLGGAEEDAIAAKAQKMRRRLERAHRVMTDIRVAHEEQRRHLAALDVAHPEFEQLRQEVATREADMASVDAEGRQLRVVFQQELRSDDFILGGISVGRLGSIAGPRRIRALDALFTGSAAAVGLLVVLVALTGGPLAGSAWYVTPGLVVAAGSLTAWLAYRQEVYELPRLDVRRFWRGRERRRLLRLLRSTLLRFLAAPGLVTLALAAASALGASGSTTAMATGLAGLVAFELLIPWAAFGELRSLLWRIIFVVSALCMGASGYLAGESVGQAGAATGEVMARIGAPAAALAAIWFLAHQARGGTLDSWQLLRHNPRGGMLGEVVRATFRGTAYTTTMFTALAVPRIWSGSLALTPAAIATTLVSATVVMALMAIPATRRYLLALLFLRGRLPFRLGHFVRWAYKVGLLRAEGPAYQFRHQELHRWLIMSYCVGGPEAAAHAYVNPPS